MPVPGSCSGAALADASMPARQRTEESAARLIQEGRPQEALALLNAAIAGGETAELWNDWATVQCACGDLVQAEEGYRRALRLDPPHRQAGVNLGFLLLAQQKLEEGLSFLERHRDSLSPAEKQALDKLIAPLLELRPQAGKALPQSSNKPCVRSFDLFDTLVARRCVEPKRIFEIMETRTGIPGLAQLRRHAEVLVSGGAYSLQDIYRELKKLLVATSEQVESLCALELKLEEENLLPVRETIAKVAPGDLIVSDTYLPKEFLRAIVDRVTGLTCNPLIATASGKNTGRIWGPLQAELELLQHTGDNLHSDIRTAQQHGIPAVHTTLTNLSPVEKELDEAGFPGLARAVREARLSSFHADPRLRSLQLLQTQANYPMLFLGSLALHRRLAAEERRQVLMSSRDAFLWRHLLEALRLRASGNYQVTYFLTSRLARGFPSPTYLDYLNRLLAEPACVVDLCGTGWSLKRLLERSSAPATPIFLLCKYDLPALEAHYETLGRTTATADLRFLFQMPGNNVIERANMARHPMLLDMKEVCGELIPVFTNPIDIAWGSVAEIQVQHDAFFLALGAMQKVDLSRDFRAEDDTVRGMAERCYARLSGCGAMFEFCREFSAQEEKSTQCLLAEMAKASASKVLPAAVAHHAASSKPSHRLQASAHSDSGPPGSVVSRFADYLARKFEATGVVELSPGQPISGDVRLDGALIYCPDARALVRNPGSLAALGASLASAPAALVSFPGSLPEASGVLWESQLRAAGLGMDLTGLAEQQPGKAVWTAILRNLPLLQTPPSFRVTAIIAAYNEADIIGEVMSDLIQQGVDVYLIDNWSSDGTFEAADQFAGRGLVGRERFPAEGPAPDYNWTALLRRKEELASGLDSDWFIHVDGDELRESPWPGCSLRDALYRVDREGYNSVDHTVIDFRPVAASYPAGMSLRETFKHFEFGMRPGHFQQVRAWKNLGLPVDLASSGGHVAAFSGTRVYPYKFLLRHYPFRSQAQAEKKVFADRKTRWNAAERARGWHVQYEEFAAGRQFIWNAAGLFPFDDRFYSEYLVERLSGIGIKERQARLGNPIGPGAD
jgi:glycosyltransferase involved in cell wall biosynthesis/tetratricopeptide (TPR) repeat protein